MNKRLQILFLLSLSGLMLATPVFAQDNETAAPSETEAGETVAEEEISDSQEVEITEDNYRQFMELKDAMRQRDVIPENVFKPGSGLQKLDKLPEESQKHLRNQLREIIVQGDEWQPGDEETEYPYTPSPAASTNPALEKQELEAWGELVDSYHERESQIYENSSGSQAARGSEHGSSNNPENGVGAKGGTGQNAEGSKGQQEGKKGNPDQGDTEGSYSLNGSGNPDTNSTAGVSQNAMEFLRGLGKGTTGTGDGAGQDSAEGGGQGETQADGQLIGQDAAQEDGQAEAHGDRTASGQADGQSQDGLQTESEQKPASSAPPVSATPVSSIEPEEESTSGASQNALEYLTGESDQSSGSTNDEPTAGQPEGTLTIQDLLNAQGLGNTTDPDPVAPPPDEQRIHNEIKPDKDG